jgi:phage terminase large subunit
MNLRLTKKTLEIIKAFNDPFYRSLVCFGGSSSGKTFGILQALIIWSIKQDPKNPKVVTTIAESYPKLSKGVIKDFRTILGDAFNSKQWNGGSHSYTFPNGTIMEFASIGYDSEQWKGPRRDVLYIDEVTAIKKQLFEQLVVRTDDTIIVSFNPSHEFYIQDLMKEENTKVIHSTYLDNPYVSDNIIQSLIQTGKQNTNFRRVYLEGEWGSYEGNIFQEDLNYFITHGIPEEFVFWKSNTIWAMDFGFSNDPTSLLELTYLTSPNKNELNKVFVKEWLYKTDQLNSDIAKVIKFANPKNIRTIADNARPEIIADLARTYHIKVEGVKKPRIVESLNLLKEVEVFIDSYSINTIKEFRNYAWKTDRNGEQTGEPIDGWNHSIDAIRYGFINLHKANYRGNISVTQI